MAGEYLEATVDITNDTTYVLPGKSIQLHSMSRTQEMP